MLPKHSFLERKSLIFSNGSVRWFHFNRLVHKSLIIGFEGKRRMSAFGILTLKSQPYNTFVAVKSQTESAHLKSFLKHSQQGIIYRNDKFPILGFRKLRLAELQITHLTALKEQLCLSLGETNNLGGHRFILCSLSSLSETNCFFHNMVLALS